MNSKYSSIKPAQAWGVAFLVMIVSFTAHAATFCATTTAELQTDLTAAAGNNEDNTIEVLENMYDVPAGGFVYSSNSNHSLDLEGGWFHFVGPAFCEAQEFTGDFTTLDGQNSDPVMRIQTDGATGNITVRYFTFQNGFGGPAALSLFAAQSTGAVRVENSLFRLNTVVMGTQYSDVVDVLNNRGVVYFLDNAVLENIGIPDSVALSLGSNDGIDTYTVYVNNNTIAGNIAIGDTITPLIGFKPAHGTFTVSNNIVWDGSASDVDNDSAITPIMIFANNDVDSFHETPAQSGDISLDPKFIDPNSGNYHLMGNSPARDAGENSPPGTTRNYDLDGNPRVVFGAVDMGAYEVQQEIFADGFGG